MSPSDSMVDGVAREFHEAYERLASQFSYTTREASAVPWEDVPHHNKSLMRAVVGELLDRRVIASSWPYMFAARPPYDACEVCGAGPQGRCDPPDSFEGECPHGCSPER